MAAVFIEGVVLAVDFVTLVRVVVEAIAFRTDALFRDVLVQLRSTLLFIQPIITNRELDREHETKQLIKIICKGQELVRKLSRIRRWNFFKKTCYTYKLHVFNKSLKRFCQIAMQTQQTRDTEDVLFEVRRISTQVRKFSSNEGSGSENGMFSQIALVGSCEVPEPQGQTELRRLSDQEVVAAPLSSGYEYDAPLSSSAPASRTTPSTLTVPMPLSLPVPEGDGEQRLLSPSEVGHGKGLETRDREKADGSPSNSSMFASCDSRKTAEDVDTRSSSKVLHQEVNRGDSSRDEFMTAPTSPFSSHAVISPHRMSTGDMFPHYIVPTGKQVWSAPEMPTLDVPGLPPPAFYDYTVFSTYNTPVHSPPNRSPRRKNRSQSGPPSPIHPELSREISSSRPEGNGPICVHPLPLPPGAAMAASPSASIPQVTTKPETLPMNCQWQKGKLIGRGTFGSVYVASNRETGALCAMKEVEIFPDDPKSAECIKQLEQEIKVLSQLKHPNIVQYYGSEIVKDKFYIYLEYVHPGSINKYVRDHYDAITESVVRNFTRHILSGLAYLHSTKTIHRDIKGANLLVDASGVVKIADFGMSKHLTGQRADLSLKGSPYWMAPELMQAVMQKDNSSDLALAVDIWSLGCTIIEMFTGKAPWSEYEGPAAMYKMMNYTPPIPETLSPEGKDFLRCCFRRNPAERPSANMLLEHPFVKSSPQSGASSSNG